MPQLLKHARGFRPTQVFKQIRTIKYALALLVLSAASHPQAQSLTVDLEVPRLDVAEYHRPYIALWVAREDNSVAANVAVLYQMDKDSDKGEKWLKDMRQWWRRTGRGLDMPIDGISGATRGPGYHQLDLSDQLTDLKPGNYRLLVEAAREVGGRELLIIPFEWPVKRDNTAREQGNKELGAVVLTLKAK